MADRDSGEVILSFLLGGLIGAAIGILYAPRAGKEIRRKLRDLGDELGDKIEHLGGDVIDKTEHLVEDSKEKLLAQKERIEAAIEAGKKAYDKKQK